MREKRHHTTCEEFGLTKSLKEWASIIRALESGKQTVLLRKGGIMETASGFMVESEKFLLYPTAEHQGYTNIKTEFHDMLENANSPPKGYNKITSYAKVLVESDITSKDTLDSLSRFHIWSNAYIDSRKNWNPEKPIKALFLKVYKIPEIIIPLKQEYQGCKSWIDVPKEIPNGVPVLNDAEIKSRLEEFRSIIN